MTNGTVKHYAYVHKHSWYDSLDGQDTSFYVLLYATKEEALKTLENDLNEYSDRAWTSINDEVIREAVAMGFYYFSDAEDVLDLKVLDLDIISVINF